VPAGTGESSVQRKRSAKRAVLIGKYYSLSDGFRGAGENAAWAEAKTVVRRGETGREGYNWIERVVIPSVWG